MDHQLDNLGPERFQQLCQALLVKEFPSVICYPVGQPDGGRDAILSQPEGSAGHFVVFQVKYARSQPAEEARDWVLNAARGEVQKVKRLMERGARSYYFITNVAGTSHLDVGSIDRLSRQLSSELGLLVHCWWRDDVNRRLDGNWDLKLRYPEVLTGQDFLRLALEENPSERDRRHRALTAFLVDQYTDDQEVKFKQVDLYNKLMDLFVDLPFTVDVPAKPLAGKLEELASADLFQITLNEKAVTYTITDTSDNKEASGTATMLLSDAGATLMPQVVVEGAPGQGKSTLAQYLCQVHRIRLLQKETDIAQVIEPHRLSPVCIPFKIDFRDLAAWIGGTDPFLPDNRQPRMPSTLTLETFLCRLVEHHSGGIAFYANDLVEISRQLPLLLVLDGLDEIADIRRRNEVVLSVTRSIPRLRENCPGLRVVITSRPAAFANSPGFDSKVFPHLHLGAVKRAQIDKYANRWMDARNITRKERSEFEQILSQKLSEPHLRDLARNPMQLAILLNLIRILGPALPDKRTSMYDEYVNLFFARESEKNPIVKKHRTLLKDIHRYLAWTLHVAAETSRRRSSGRISQDDLKELVRTYLKSEDYDTSVVDDVFGATLERIFMIVSRVEGTYEFEVQPLREYFAARFLYDTAPSSPRARAGTRPCGQT